MAEECAYYYYDNGYCCAIRREKEHYSSISGEIVHRYCWGYHYEECPYYKEYGGGSSGCFLTSACVGAMGLPDDCHELTVLRAFRDGYLAAQPEGEKEIGEYYETAPKIVDAIEKSSNGEKVFLRIYNELVKPCVELIEAGRNEEAHARYREAVRGLQVRYLTR